jgi:hypothetical protein
MMDGPIKKFAGSQALCVPGTMRAQHWKTKFEEWGNGGMGSHKELKGLSKRRKLHEE